MNLSKLFELQRQLDAHIEKEHPRQPGEDRLAKKILALQVELGELAQEWRGFKYWSHDQEPRTKIEYICPTCNGTGDENYDSYIDDLEGGYTHEVINCEDCGGTGTLGYKNTLLEEFADALHFILSIGLELEITAIEIDSDYTHEDPSATFVELFGDTWELFNFREIHDKQSKFIQISIYERMFNRFVGIGEKHLGFTWEQIEEAYMRKNRENHQRQESGY